MKKLLKRFIKLSWHGIPIGIIATVLIGIAVAASLYISTTQIITQTIEPEPPPKVYGTITAPDINLDEFGPPLYAGGQSFGSVFPNHVAVELGVDGAGKHLWLELAADALYAEYEVKLTCRESADLAVVPIGTEVIVDMTNWRTSIPLGVAGTYRFDEFIHLKTGPTAGSASTDFKVAISSCPY